MEESEYLELRKHRNKLRDDFEKAPSFLESESIKREIRDIDKKLSKFETVNTAKQPMKPEEKRELVYNFETLIVSWLKSGNENATYLAELLVESATSELLPTKEKEQFAVHFANWLDSLKPSQRVSVWSKSGEHKGLFTMDNEQLLDKFKRHLTLQKTDILKRNEE